MNTSPVISNEWLARYILSEDHIRKDGTVKPDPFIPYKHVELSVTRHIGLEENEIWQAGELVASQREDQLIGRADIVAQRAVDNGLTVLPAPLLKNHNHANIIGWPAMKPDQKIIALELVKGAVFVKR